MHSQIQEQFPQNREHQPLQSVGEDTGLQPTSEEALDTVLRDDGFRSSEVPYPCRVHLAVRLDYTERVRDSVGHDRRAESDERLAKEFLPKVRRGREDLVQVVVRPEPGVMADEGRCRGRERAVPQRSYTIALDLRKAMSLSIRRRDS